MIGRSGSRPARAGVVLLTAAVALTLAFLLVPAGPAAAKRPASSPAPTQTAPSATPAPATHTLTIRVNGSGTTDPDTGRHDYPEDTAVAVLAVPDDGWDFDGWEGDVADAGEANTTTRVDANKTITATFSEIEEMRTLTTPVNGRGSIDREAGTRDGAGGDVDEAGDKVGKGEQSNRRIEDADGDDERNAATSIDGGRAVTAESSDSRETHTLTIRVKGSGTTEPDPGKHDYAEGTEVSVAAVPDGGWLFDGWKGDVDDDTRARTTVTIDEDETVTARFSEAPTPTPVADSEPADPTPTEEPAPEPTVVPVATPESTPEPTITPEPTPEPTTAPTATPEPTPEPTTAPTATPGPTPEPTLAPTATPEPTTAPGPLPVPALYVSRDSGEPGCTARVQGTTFAAQVAVEIRFAGVLVKTVPTDESGRFSAEFAIPSSAQAGRNAIEATDAGGNTATLFFEVTAPPSGPQPTTAPAPPSEATQEPGPSSTPMNEENSSPSSGEASSVTECEIDLNGSIDDSGVLTDDVVMSLTGGEAEVYLARGTVALDADGLPVEGFRLERVEDLAAPSPDCQIVGFGYFCGPDGATFDPPAAITISYDPELCPEGSSSEDLVIAYFDAEKREWVDVESYADTANHSIAGQASHFSVFAVIAEGQEPVPWSLVVGIIAGAVVFGVAIAPYLVRWRRSRSP